MPDQTDSAVLVFEGFRWQLAEKSFRGHKIALEDGEFELDRLMDL
jgi:hypothetical protein